jgi:hypothetical protein
VGRHRSDPMGLARMALAVLAVIAVLAVVVVGGMALVRSLDADEPPPRTHASTTPSGTARVPTVRIECVADTCPLITVRVPGGDVLQHRDMSRGEELSYYEPELDVVLSDAGTVRVTENGSPRPQGDLGDREAFTVRAPGE